VEIVYGEQSEKGKDKVTRRASDRDTYQKS